MRLLDSGLNAAVEFLSAADRTRAARQALSTAHHSLDNAKSSADQNTYQRFLKKVEETQESAVAAITDAENAYAALRVLLPSGANQARKYLDLCIQANQYPDETKVDRERARHMTEEAIRRAFGRDLPDDWVFAEPVPGPRWWQIRRRRAARQASGSSKAAIQQAPLD